VAAKGRIEIQCPHCGNIQLEPEFARSTYCRKCSGYIPLDKARRTVEPQQESKAPSVLQKIEGFLGVQRTIVARCFECDGKREVPKSATSTICPLCGSYIDLQDYKITGNYSRAIRTRGAVYVTPKGDLSTNRVVCEEAQIQGTLRGSLHCTGIAKVKLKGKLTGSIDGKHILIERKSDLELVRPLKGELIQIQGVVNGRIISSGTVKIDKGGRLTGSVSAKGFVVEKGGEFFGDLTIGNVDMVQGELLSGNHDASSDPDSPGSDADNRFSLTSS
jgi:cytoskeletal protein CcmA (bactofilin family)